eukprot:Filipodium_phascolosomae@DN4668_c0_g1_i1.p1
MIAAVNGVALGGGCELAMMCDIVLASDNAVFGQPEVLIGTIPGMGGTQRLVRLIGKSKAMELILTGRKMRAEEAEKAGLISRVVPASASVVEEALTMAESISGLSRPITRKAKECIKAAETLPLQQGLELELAAFQNTFSLEDRRE